MIDKVLEAARKGNLRWKTKRKIVELVRNRKKVVCVNNKDVKAIVYQCKDYNKLYKKYEKKIKEGVHIKKESDYSDKVWVCWFQGYDAAPFLVKACINSIYRSMPDKEVIILTNENYVKYVNLPEYIIKKFETGQIGFAHFSDILRISLLAKWGGMWIDSTALCTNADFFEYASKQPLFVFKELNLGNRDNPPILASSWFISCKTNNPIIILTRDLLYLYWKDYDFTINYFTFHLFFAMACRRYRDEWNNIPTFNNNSPHTLMFELDKEYSNERWQQIMDMSGIHKLQRYNDYSHLKKSNYCHILENYL